MSAAVPAVAPAARPLLGLGRAGLEAYLVDKIKKVKTGNSGFHQNVPVEPVTILKAEVLN